MAKSTISPHSLRFTPDPGLEFEQTLKKRVRAYFKDSGISRNANAAFVVKVVAMMSLYFTPYFLMIFGVVTNPWLIALCWFIMGLGMVGIGMGFMHDANHGSISKNDKVNKFIGKVLSLVGGYQVNWRIQHNVLHHSYTNLTGYDEDIDAPGEILRFSPKTKLRKLHRYQHFYAWFLYGFLTLAWIAQKDYTQLFRYKKLGLTKIENEKFHRLFIELIISKVIYYAYVFVVPMLVMDIPWWGVILGIVLMHFVAGVILSVVFQLAHVVPNVNFPEVEANKVASNWAVHQMNTTANFAPHNRFLSWFVGGLNYQIEHHLFPNVSHIHYKKIAPIVRSTAQEFGVPYHTEPTFFSAIISHARMLKHLGRA